MSLFSGRYITQRENVLLRIRAKSSKICCQTVVQFLQHNENNVETDITKKAGKENGCVQINIANALELYNTSKPSLLNK